MLKCEPSVPLKNHLFLSSLNCCCTCFAMLPHHIGTCNSVYFKLGHFPPAVFLIRFCSFFTNCVALQLPGTTCRSAMKVTKW